MSGLPKDDICKNRGTEETQCRNLAIRITLGSLASFVRPWPAKPTKSAHDGDGAHNSRLFGVPSYVGGEERIVLNERAVERGGLSARFCFISHGTNKGTYKLGIEQTRVGFRRETYNVESSKECRFIVSTRLP